VETQPIVLAYSFSGAITIQLEPTSCEPSHQAALRRSPRPRPRLRRVAVADPARRYGVRAVQSRPSRAPGRHRWPGSRHRLAARGRGEAANIRPADRVRRARAPAIVRAAAVTDRVDDDRDQPKAAGPRHSGLRRVRRGRPRRSRFERPAPCASVVGHRAAIRPTIGVHRLVRVVSGGDRRRIHGVGSTGVPSGEKQPGGCRGDVPGSPCRRPQTTRRRTVAGSGGHPCPLRSRLVIRE
jgi:hypothetical protein